MYDLSQMYPASIVGLFEERIRQSQSRRTRVVIRDKDGDIKEEITEVLPGSDIYVSRLERPHRRLNLSFYRPKSRLSPSDLWVSDTWQVFYEVYIDELNTSAYDYRGGGWVSVPVFAGVLAPGTFKRSDINSSIVNVTCFGYEQKYSYPLGRTRSVPKGMRNSEAIAYILNHYDDLTGSNAIKKSLATSTSKLAKEYHYGSVILGQYTPHSPWAAVKQLAAGCGGWALYINADFEVVLKPISHNPVRTFSVSNKNIVDPPQKEANLSNLKNHIVVWGDKPEGKAQIRGEAFANDKYSPEELGWQLTEEIEESSVGNVKAANDLAAQKLTDRLKVVMSVQLDSVIDPRLEEYDYVKIDYADESYVIPVTNFNIPLIEGQQMISSARKSRAERIYSLRKRRLKAGKK